MTNEERLFRRADMSQEEEEFEHQPRGFFRAPSDRSMEDVPSSSSDRDGDFSDSARPEDDALAGVLAKLTLALRASVTSAAKSHTGPITSAVVAEWAEKTNLSANAVEIIFNSLSPWASGKRASANAARASIAAHASASDVAAGEGDEEEYSPPASDGVPALEQGVPFPGIPKEVRVNVICAGMKGILVLPKGYKKLQERVLVDGASMRPSQFEADAGRGSAKKWKISIRVMRKDGGEGGTVADWIEKHGYHPAGLVVGGDEVKPAPAPAKTTTKKSDFEAKLENLLDEDGDIELASVKDFIRFMQNTSRTQERSLLLQVIRGTKNKKCLRAFAAGNGLDALQTWMGECKKNFQSTLLVSILRTLKLIPVTLDVLTKTSIGADLTKLKSYEVPVGEAEHGNTEMNTKVVLLSKSVKTHWKSQITASNATESPKTTTTTAPPPAKAAPPSAPVPEKAAAAAAAVSKAVELGDDDLFGGAKKSAPAPVKAPVKTVTKITMEKKVAPPPSVSTKKPSVSVSDLINKNSKATTKVGAAPPQRETKQETTAGGGGGGGEAQGKKRKRKSVTWASDDMLEQVRVFEKDAKQPKEVAFPDPVRDGMDASALERRDREVEAERKAAAKQHQRRLDEMRAYVPWRTPRAVVLPPDPDAHEPITPGCDSEEFQRILRIEAERPSVKYKRVTDIPDSPAEAPNEDDQLDLANTPAFSLEFQAEPAAEPAPAQYAAPPLAAPAFDASALAALAASLQQGPAAAAAPPPATSYVQPHIPAQPAAMPMNYPPAPAPAPKQVTVGGAPVPIQNNIVVNGKTYRGVCAFFNTPRGCNWGDKCGYLHQAGINP